MRVLGGCNRSEHFFWQPGPCKNVNRKNSNVNPREQVAGDVSPRGITIIYSLSP